MRPLAIVVALALGGCAHSPAYDPEDPLEDYNRAIYSFNEKADYFVLRPMARAYEWTLPGLVRRGISNFFNNLGTPVTVLNDILQLKIVDAGKDLGRFVINSTIGLGGLINVTGDEGIPEHDEDFGQTLGYWGVGPGWYLMLPFLGPSSNRDLVGAAGDWVSKPGYFVEPPEAAWGLGVLNAVDTRAQLLSFDQVLEQQLDRYVFIRTIYLQNRENKVYDGNPPKEDFDFED